MTDTKQRREDIDGVPKRCDVARNTSLDRHAEIANLKQKLAISRRSERFKAEEIEVSKRENQELKTLAYNDSLTGIFNQRGLIDAFANQCENAKGAIIFVDLDKFKEINDIHGHKAGDDALKLVAKILRDNVRAGIDIVARYGGDEFVIVLNDMTKGEAVAKTASIREIFETTYMHISDETGNHSIKVGASFGMETFNAGDDLQEIKAAADRKMYIAKKEKGNNPR